MEATSLLKPYPISLPVEDWQRAREIAAAQQTTGPAIVRKLLADWLASQNTTSAREESDRK